MHVQSKRKLNVPDLEGLSAENASIYLELNGFPKPDIRYEESFEPQMTVLSQDPPKGQIVDADTVITIHVSQRSFAEFLPAIYRTSFYEGYTHLRDYLWIIRHMFDSVGYKVNNIANLFDPYETPADFLPWLAGWIGFVLDEDWPEGKKRYLLRRAVDYYRIRPFLSAWNRKLSKMHGHSEVSRLKSIQQWTLIRSSSRWSIPHTVLS